MATKKNIIIGAARIAVGPSLDPVSGAAAITALKATGTTPQWTHLGFDAATGLGSGAGAGWRDVGYTQDGLEVATDPSFTDVEVDQLLDAAKIFKDGMSVTVSPTFAEATLENLLVAWGQADNTVSSAANEKVMDIEGGNLGQAPLERGLIAVGNAPEKTGSNNYGERSYFLYRVLSVEASSVSLARAEATTVPVSFRALPADNAKYGFIRDRMNV